MGVGIDVCVRARARVCVCVCVCVSVLFCASGTVLVILHGRDLYIVKLLNIFISLAHKYPSILVSLY